MHVETGQLRELEKRRSRIDQRLDPVARQHAAARDVARPRLLAAAAPRGRTTRLQSLEQRPISGLVEFEFFILTQVRLNDRHRLP